MEVNAIIIITSPKKNQRFTTEELEWKAWKFEEGRLIAYRINDGKVQYLDEVDDNNIKRLKIKQDQKIIVWLNTSIIEMNDGDARDKKVQNIINKIAKAISNLNIVIAYHSDIPNTYPSEFEERSKNYSLAYGNEEQFKEIIIEENGQKYLNSSASFEVIYECFFLNLPKVISVLKHKILNLLTPIKTDIEALIEYDFDTKYFKKVSKSLKKFDLDKLLNESLGEGLYKIIIKNKDDKHTLVGQMLNSLKTGDLSEFKKMIRLHGNVYNIWLDELVNALDKIIKKPDELKINEKKNLIKNNCNGGINIINEIRSLFNDKSKNGISVNIDKKIKFSFIFIGHEECKTCNKNWDKFLNSLNKKRSYNYSAFLFYTTEELPRGDYPDSIYNESRLVREFFENSYCARTANYKNLIQKVKELIVEIKLKGDKCDFSKSKSNLETLISYF